MSMLFDSGLQLERTALAWRRSCLALGIGSVAALRLLPSMLGSVWWLLPGIAGLALSAFLHAWNHRRYIGFSTCLLGNSDPSRRPGAGALIVLAATTMAIGAFCTALILTDVFG